MPIAAASWRNQLYITKEKAWIISHVITTCHSQRVTLRYVVFDTIFDTFHKYCATDSANTLKWAYGTNMGYNRVNISIWNCESLLVIVSRTYEEARTNIIACTVFRTLRRFFYYCCVFYQGFGGAVRSGFIWIVLFNKIRCFDIVLKFVQT